MTSATAIDREALGSTADYVDHRGVTSAEAAKRLREQGPNEIRRDASVSRWKLLAAQFNSPVIWLLIGASIVSVVLREGADAIAIATIVVINGVIGFLQEYRAERALLALRSLTAPRSRVVRDGRTQVVSASNVVVGDLLVLEAGDVVAADARVLEAHVLSANEAPLTGESIPTVKSSDPVDPAAPLAERHDRIFMGTAIATGTGMAEVFATGMRTELGRIANLLSSAEDSETPLQRRLARVSRILLLICLMVVALVALLGLLRGNSLIDVFISAVSLAVAAVPEGLPAVVTIALAVGMQRMAAQRALIRRMHAVETLGCATVICTDKTGTLTTGVMAVREIWGSDHEQVLGAAAACCDAELAADEKQGVGDPTEVAILVAAAARGIRRAEIERKLTRAVVNPFDSDRKRMSILRSDGTLYVKGALETVLPLCSSGTVGAEAANQDMAARGLRVLAIATTTAGEERDLQLLGLIAIADPPRSEAIAAVAAARAAGVKTVMITGDHPVTARAIGRELGIIQPGESEAERVHARATPEQKLRIVRDWKARGEVVAMTGDGVNDAPALREAHIGIAMGKSGTEVTREASDMVLADDNFATIVEAIREGRGIFDNIRKTLVYLLAGNTGELLVMFVAALMGLPLPLLPLHLLWINLVTDGLPALALVMDPADDDVMHRPPRGPDEAMLGRGEWIHIGVTGVLQAAVALSVFTWAIEARGIQEARNLAFSTLVFAELFRAFAARSTTRLFWEVGAFTNLRLLAVVLISISLQLAIHHLPATQKLFEIGDLALADCAFAVLVALIPVSALELIKLVRRGIARSQRRP
ncbi:MAG TPA: cation-translocating P-type ATPase [Polyangiaceae bacterium]|nr:cation-translocating P-type ATPase [Polyangiaceae bacterium]